MAAGLELVGIVGSEVEDRAEVGIAILAEDWAAAVAELPASLDIAVVLLVEAVVEEQEMSKLVHRGATLGLL